MKTIDWVITFVAVAAAAFLMAAAERTREVRRVSVSMVRDLELPGKVLDAKRSLPEELRGAIGMAGDPDADPETMISEVGGLLAKYDPAPAEARLLVAGIALAYGRDGAAVEQLDLVEQNEQAISAWQPIVADLRALARGSAASDIEALVGRLDALHTSSWFDHHLRARHLENAGEHAAARAEREQASALASVCIDRMVTSVMVFVVLGFLGLVLLLVWPLIRRAIFKTHFVGLRGSISAFEVASTYRVMALWFLGLLVGVFAGAFLAQMGGSAVLSVAAQTFIHGTIAVILIQHLGRQPNDQEDLTTCFKARPRNVEGGLVGLVLWIVGGLAVALVVTFAAAQLNAEITGSPTGPQSSVDLLSEQRSAPALIALILTYCLAAPIFEELIFRGFLYQNLRQLLGPMAAVLLSGAVFALCHLDLYNAIPLMALGGTLAWLFERSGSLLVPIGVHALWNLSQVLSTLIMAVG